MPLGLKYHLHVNDTWNFFSIPDLPIKFQTHLSNFLQDIYTWISNGHHEPIMVKTPILISPHTCSSSVFPMSGTHSRGTQLLRPCIKKPLLVPLLFLCFPPHFIHEQNSVNFTVNYISYLNISLLLHCFYPRPNHQDFRMAYFNSLLMF